MRPRGCKAGNDAPVCGVLDKHAWFAPCRGAGLQSQKWLCQEKTVLTSYLDAFHSVTDGRTRISPEQASAFAKGVAGDFNPLHDPDNKRFCVPGDLLFCLALARYGVSRSMRFDFINMVGAGVDICFPNDEGGELTVTDLTGRPCLKVWREGPTGREPRLLEDLTRAYAEFSGHNFPHVMVPLMESRQVMLHPQRPLVIYASMGFEFDGLPTGIPELKFVGAELAVDGKRGEVDLNFELLLDGRTAGRGSKHLVLSGLRPFDARDMDAMVGEYDRRKAAYSMAHAV